MNRKLKLMVVPAEGGPKGFPVLWNMIPGLLDTYMVPMWCEGHWRPWMDTAVRIQSTSSWPYRMIGVV